MSKLLNWISLILILLISGMLIFGTVFLLMRNDPWAGLGIIDIIFTLVIAYYGMTLGMKTPEPTL